MTEKIELPENPKIVVVRTDRIGDVVLSLPVIESIRRAYPKAHICALTRGYTSDLFSLHGGVDEIISFDSDSPHIPRKEFCRILDQVRNKNFDCAIALYSNISVAALLALARIPVRIGPAGKIARIFLTHAITQRRSKQLKHEADHNLDLLRPLLIKPVRVATVKPPQQPLCVIDRPAGKPLVGVHPGHGGSSLNWPARYYARLVTELHSAGITVVVTGSKAERELVESVSTLSGVSLQTFIGEGGLHELASVLSQFDVFVAGSTGPLHLAGAVGTKVVGIYCPIYVCLPERWGPIGDHAVAVRPEVPACKKCTGLQCPHYDCMESISVEQIKTLVLERTVTGSTA